MPPLNYKLTVSTAQLSDYLAISMTLLSCDSKVYQVKICWLISVNDIATVSFDWVVSMPLLNHKQIEINRPSKDIEYLSHFGADGKTTLGWEREAQGKMFDELCKITPTIT
jgi:hypothetical protein